MAQERRPSERRQSQEQAATSGSGGRTIPPVGVAGNRSDTDPLKRIDMSPQVVSGIYASRFEAESVRSHLLEVGLPCEQIEVVERVRADDHSSALSDSDGVLKEVLIDGAVGTVVGTGLGAIGEAVLAAANITLFTTSPFVAPLAMLGWGASVGGLIGAAIGAGGVKKKGRLSDILLYAIRSGHVTLIAHTRSEQETRLASGVMGASMVGRSEQRSGTCTTDQRRGT